MKIKFSALVSDMRGKLNGSVASRNRGGSYLRNKTTPVNPQTPAQQVIRSIFGAISSQWRSLAEPVRESYRQGADQFPYIDIFGDSRHLSGSQLFQRVNMNIVKLEGDIKTTAFTAPSAFPAFPDQVEMDIVATTGAIDVNIPDLSLGANQVLVFYATPPLGAGISFAKNQFRMLDNQFVEVVGDVYTLTDAYSVRFGTITAGEKIQLRIAIVDVPSGFQSAPLIVESIAS